MAIDAPTNPWTHVESALAAALPECASFRAFAGADDATEAAESVFLEELGESPSGRAWSAADLAELSRYAVVSSAEEQPYRGNRITADAFAVSGELRVAFERRIAPGAEEQADTLREGRNQVDRELKNLVGSMVNELIDYWDEAGGPYLTGFAVLMSPLHTHPDAREAEGHWQMCELSLAWGVTPN